MPQQDVYELIAKLCTLEPVQDLLRKYKQELPKDKKKEVLVSGENKSEIVTTNLRQAVEAGFIPKSERDALLQDAEENGSQHTFLFRPKNRDVAKRCRDGESIAGALWEANWRKKMEFPKFDLIPETYVWADFRVGLPSKPSDWVGKLYGHETWMKHLKDKDEKVSDTHVIKHFERQDLRMVCLIRWNNSDMLELRVPRSESWKDQHRRVAILWQHVSAALDQADFIPWQLQKIGKEMLRQQSEEEDVYETGDKEFIDSESCRTTISMHSADDAPHASGATQAAVQAHIDDDESACERLIVHWKPNQQNKLTKSLRTQLGTHRNPHELVIFSQTTSIAVDYVLNQLRRFNG